VARMGHHTEATLNLYLCQILAAIQSKNSIANILDLSHAILACIYQDQMLFQAKPRTHKR